MNNKAIALIISVFIIVMMAIICLIGISSHIPFIGKGLSLIFAVVLIVFVLAVVIIFGRRKK